ncbi:neutral cholesterol ester hydrolase 1-like [Mercenaria mercenaria]|uniref:neutral cholesterol ester hydrolase 1-like n=1 Tax=Mercenaria mercenaria TaxID=6596 RepID=UPI00234F8B65|nr:neutral cholesterol ester hydrolase 1-like [Mercenaria mercenaria]
MYVPDGHTLTSTGSLVASQLINLRVYLRDLFGARTPDSRSSTEKPEDGILYTRLYGLGKKEEKNLAHKEGDDVGGNLALSVALNISKDEPRLAKNIRLVGIFYSPLQAFDFNLPSYAKYARQTEVFGKRDIVEQFSLYLFGDTNSTLVEMLMDNLHTTAEQKTSERAEILDMNMLPFSFREYKEPELTVNAGNEQLSREISHLILDDRVSPMMASADDLQNLPHTYFIAPEVDPVRDESIMLYGALRELDIDKNVHVYYRTEKHGFLTEFRKNDVAKRAISEFIVHLKKISRRH